jgi:hypothetical protein
MIGEPATKFEVFCIDAARWSIASLFVLLAVVFCEVCHINSELHLSSYLYKRVAIILLTLVGHLSRYAASGLAHEKGRKITVHRGYPTSAA